MKDAQQFYFSAVYGSNDGVERRRLWSHLYSLNTIMSAEPWLIAGDFNVILHPSESSNDHQGFTSDMRDFMESKVKISVFDHAFSGPLFTWSNHQLDGFLARKLDRVLINGNWLPCFAQSQVEFLPPEISDHCPALIQLQQDNYSPPKPFKFFNYWTKHGKFLEVVEQSWNEAVLGDPMSRLHQKMKRLKAKLKEFNQDEFGNVTHKVTEKRKI